MEEKAKTVDMFGLDPSLDTYYDEEEQENVREIQYEWDYINKYHFTTTFDEDEEEWQDSFSEETRELLYDLRDRIRALRKDAISIKAIEEYERILFEVNSVLSFPARRVSSPPGARRLLPSRRVCLGLSEPHAPRSSSHCRRLGSGSPARRLSIGPSAPRPRPPPSHPPLPFPFPPFSPTRSSERAWIRSRRT